MDIKSVTPGERKLSANPVIDIPVNPGCGLTSNPNSHSSSLSQVRQRIKSFNITPSFSKIRSGISSSFSPVDSTRNGAKSKAEVYAQMAKELKKEMHSIFICTTCNTKGNIIQVTDDTLPVGEIQAGDSWALKMVKMNTRYELHPAGKAPGPSGTETAPELRRLPRLSSNDNDRNQKARQLALAIINKMQRDHKMELQQQRDSLDATLVQKERQIQDKERILTLFQEKVRSLSVKLDAQTRQKSEHISLMDDNEKIRELLLLEKDRNKALKTQYISLNTIYQENMGYFNEEQKKNLRLISDHEKLVNENQQLRSNHEESQALADNQKPLMDVGMAMRLRWLENIHFMFVGQQGRALDGLIVEAGNAAAHHANFEADCALLNNAGLSVYASDRVIESMHRVYGQRHAPKSSNSPFKHAYPPSVVFTLNCKTTTAVHQFRDKELIIGPQHQRLRFILREMRALWERSITCEEFEAISRVQELREEVDRVWGAVQVAFRDKRRRIRASSDIQSVQNSEVIC